jgi:hypothetical protein
MRLFVLSFAIVACSERDRPPAPPAARDESEGSSASAERSAPESTIALAPEDRRTLAVGDEFSCAIAGGEVRCWGDGSHGQLGDGSAARTGPVAIAGIADAIAISAGDHHACALRSSGAVRCWGELAAIGSPLHRFDASRDLRIGRAAGIACGGAQTCARLDAGGVVCLDASGNPAVRSLPGPASALAAGGHHACARLADRTMRCWGQNLNGGLGDGTQAPSDDPIAPAGPTGVSRIAAAVLPSCALDGAGRAWCWGLTHHDPREGLAPGGPSVVRSDVADVVAGGDHVCFFLRAGGTACTSVVHTRVFPNGGLGHALTVDLVLPADTVEVALGRHHRCIRTIAGAVQCWGNGDAGQSGGGGELVQTPTTIAL